MIRMIVATTHKKSFVTTNDVCCDGICQKYRGRKKGYIDGQRRCNKCEIMLNWPGLWCPCCNARLRSRPRKKVSRVKDSEARY
jgi:hypothetical protein